MYNGRAGYPPGSVDRTGPGSGIPFGIYGLSHTPADAMESGAIYALDADISALRLPVVSSCIAEALAAGVPCTLIVRGKPDAYLHQLNTPVKFDVAGEIARRHLNVLVMQDEFQKKMFQAGPQRMLDELSHFGVPDRSLVVFEHATDLLNLYDAKLAQMQIEAISSWCSQHHSVALLVFSSVHGRDVVPPEALLDGMAGLARLEQAEAGLRVRFPYWQSGGALTTGLTASLNLDSEGRFIASVPTDETAAGAPVLQSESRATPASSENLHGRHETVPPFVAPVRERPASTQELRDVEPRGSAIVAKQRAGAPITRARRGLSQDFPKPKQSTP